MERLRSGAGAFHNAWQLAGQKLKAAWRCCAQWWADHVSAERLGFVAGVVAFLVLLLFTRLMSREVQEMQSFVDATVLKEMALNPEWQWGLCANWCEDYVEGKWWPARSVCESKSPNHTQLLTTTEINMTAFALEALPRIFEEPHLHAYIVRVGVQRAQAMESLCPFHESLNEEEFRSLGIVCTSTNADGHWSLRDLANVFAPAELGSLVDVIFSGSSSVPHASRYFQFKVLSCYPAQLLVFRFNVTKMAGTHKDVVSSFRVDFVAPILRHPDATSDEDSSVDPIRLVRKVLGAACLSPLDDPIVTKYECRHGVSHLVWSVYSTLYAMRKDGNRLYSVYGTLGYDDVYAIYTGMMGALFGAAAVVVGSALVVCLGLFPRPKKPTPRLRRLNAMRRRRGLLGSVRLFRCWTSGRAPAPDHPEAVPAISLVVQPETDRPGD